MPIDQQHPDRQREAERDQPLARGFAALLPEQQTERDQRDQVLGHGQRMQQSAVEVASTFDRRMRSGGPRREESERQERLAAVHAMPVRRARPASAIAPPPARTAVRPAGH